MAYRTALPKVFLLSYKVPESEMAPTLALLLAPNSRFPNGSSFAVTVDTEEGTRCLWLSEASARRIGIDEEVIALAKNSRTREEGL